MLLVYGVSLAAKSYTIRFALPGKKTAKKSSSTPRPSQVKMDVNLYYFWLRISRREGKNGNSKKATLYRRKATNIRRQYKYTRYYSRFLEKR